MIDVNRFGNCGTDLLGSGSRSCDLSLFGDATGFIMFKKGFTMPRNTANAETFFKEKLKAFEVFPYLDIYEFTQDAGEDDIATSSRGRQTIIRSSNQVFTFDFDRGACIHKSLYNKRGNGRWDFAFVFEGGLLMAINSTGTAFVPFDGGLFNVATLRLQQGTDPQASTSSIQLTNATQFNQRFVFIPWDNLGFDLNELNGVVDTKISYTVLPTATDEIRVKVASACNFDDVILGLDETTSWVLGGTQAATTTITGVTFNASTGEYVLALSADLATNDTVQPRLVSAGGYDVAEDDAGNLFKGKAQLFTVGGTGGVNDGIVAGQFPLI